MAFPTHQAGFAATHERPVSRRYAWTVFAIVFALMVVDYVDRQVVASMFPHLKAHWDLSDGQLGAYLGGPEIKHQLLDMEAQR